MIWLPSNNSSNKIDIQAHRATEEQVYWWEKVVQPTIKTGHNSKNSSLYGRRLDYKFNWLKIYQLIQKQELKGQMPIKREIDIIQGYSTHYNRWFPLSIILSQFPVTALNDFGFKSIYLGMLATTPPDLLRTWFSSSYPKLIGQASVRFIVEKSMSCKLNGFTGAHVIPIGCGLIDFLKPDVDLANLTPKDHFHQIFKIFHRAFGRIKTMEDIISPTDLARYMLLKTLGMSMCNNLKEPERFGVLWIKCV